MSSYNATMRVRSGPIHLFADGALLGEHPMCGVRTEMPYVTATGDFVSWEMADGDPHQDSRICGNCRKIALAAELTLEKGQA